MKYRIIKTSDTDFDIITEDGGVASVHYNGEKLCTNYYQSRLTDIDCDDDIWEQLSEGKIYNKDWTEKESNQEIITDALNWLVVTSIPMNWEIDNSLYNQILN